ncbi:MAG: hypothetical protein ACRDYZ_16385 [Acidimicrobiales bacterium]
MAAWAVLWGLFALLRALPGNNTASAMSKQVGANATGSPSWLVHGEHVISATIRIWA